MSLRAWTKSRQGSERKEACESRLSQSLISDLRFRWYMYAISPATRLTMLPFFRLNRSNSGLLVSVRFSL